MCQHAFFGLAKVVGRACAFDVCRFHSWYLMGNLSCSTWKRLMGHKHEKYSIHCFKWECFLDIFEGKKTDPIAEETT